MPHFDTEGLSEQASELVKEIEDRYIREWGTNVQRAIRQIHRDTGGIERALEELAEANAKMVGKIVIAILHFMEEKKQTA